MDEHGYDFVIETINRLSKSDYLLGKTEHNFILHYKWFYQHIDDIHEGIYDKFDKKPKKIKLNIDYEAFEDEFLANK